MSLLLSLLTNIPPAPLLAACAPKLYQDRRKRKREAMPAALEAHGPMDVKTMAERIGVPRQTLYKIIIEMEKDGLVTCAKGMKCKGCLFGSQTWSLK